MGVGDTTVGQATGHSRGEFLLKRGLRLSPQPLLSIQCAAPKHTQRHPSLYHLSPHLIQPSILSSPRLKAVQLTGTHSAGHTSASSAHPRVRNHVLQS